MFCKHCGKYNLDVEKNCKYCGYPLEQAGQKKRVEIISSKRGVGVFMCLFFNIFGLILGLLLYPAGSYERSTFVSGWVRTLVACVVIYLLVVGFITCAGIMATGRY